MERVWAGILGSGLLLAACAYFTRAGRRRILAAVGGGVAAAALNIAIDIVASAAGLWRYPEVATPYAPLWFYTGPLMGVAAISLIIWRLMRRYGWLGLATALVAVAVLFPIRDARVAASTHVIEFADGLAPWIADSAAAVAVFAVGVAVMRVLAGPAADDALPRR